MKCAEYKLTAPEDLILQSVRVGTIERREYYDRTNGLRIVSNDGRLADLPGAVDVSEQLEEPRVFVIEGVDTNRFFIFGGENAFWVSTDLTETSRLDLFRKAGLEEYWTTTVLEQSRTLIFIYEAGVLAIDERLQVLLHREKLINDFFVAIEHDALKFVRDHEEEWLMPLGYD